MAGQSTFSAVAIRRKLFEREWQPPERFRNVSWDHVGQCVRLAVEEVLESLKTSKPKGLVLLGPVGSGKTSIVWLLLREWILQWLDRITPELPDKWKRLNDNQHYDGYLSEEEFLGKVGGFGHTFAVLKHGELVRQLRADAEERKTYGRGEWHEHPPLLERKLICIDDLGVGYDDSSGWNLALQEEYFDWRWEVGLPLIVTTNRGLGEGSGSLRGWSGWERIVDRLVDPNYSVRVSVPGPSKRVANQARQLGQVW